MEELHENPGMLQEIWKEVAQEIVQNMEPDFTSDQIDQGQSSMQSAHPYAMGLRGKAIGMYFARRNRMIKKWRKKNKMRDKEQKWEQNQRTTASSSVETEKLVETETLVTEEVAESSGVETNVPEKYHSPTVQAESEDQDSEDKSKQSESLIASSSEKEESQLKDADSSSMEPKECLVEGEASSPGSEISKSSLQGEMSRFLQEVVEKRDQIPKEKAELILEIVQGFSDIEKEDLSEVRNETTAHDSQTCTFCNRTAIYDDLRKFHLNLIKYKEHVRKELSKLKTEPAEGKVSVLKDDKPDSSTAAIYYQKQLDKDLESGIVIEEGVTVGCQTCHIILPVNAFEAHISGQKHMRKMLVKGKLDSMEDFKPTKGCKVCLTLFNTKLEAANHYKSLNHGRHVEEVEKFDQMLLKAKTSVTEEFSSKPETPQKVLESAEAYYCDLCEVKMSSEQETEEHVLNETHKKLLREEMENEAKKLVSRAEKETQTTFVMV